MQVWAVAVEITDQSLEQCRFGKWLWPEPRVMQVWEVAVARA